MSGFQIPGLGQAKPNETLPPLPADITTVAVSQAPDTMDFEPPVARADAQNPPLPEPKPVQTQPEHVVEPDAMAVDQPESPPSLTGALEAALDGLAPPAPAPNPSAEPSTTTTNPPPAELQNDQGDNPEWEIDSSPYESSSESSSSDSSDDDDSDNEGYELLGVEETARLLMQAEGGSDDEGDRSGKGSSSAQVRTKNEIIEETAPKPEVEITPDMKIEELGVIEHIVESIALVKAFTPGEYQVLDSGSVLCTAERVVIGVVGETIGKVLQPMYTVRFSSNDEAQQLGLEVGTKVYYPVEHATFVFTEPLKNLKGSDASNLHDEEVGDDEMEFSDDEKEAEHKRAAKQKKKDKWNKGKGAAAAKDPHPLRQEVLPDGGLNYDDNNEDDDGPYKPLARPAGFGSAPVPETYEPAPGRPFQRGRRGDSRGRGSRGRGGPGRGGRGARGGFAQPRDGYSLPPQGPPQPAAAPHSPWSGTAPPAPQLAVPPAAPAFGFPFAGWPQPPNPSGGPAAVPPPPPGWPVQNQPGEPAQPGAAPFVNPAFFAALMTQMQQQTQKGQPSWPPQPPNNGSSQ